MTQLKEKGVYEITAEMKEGLKDFVGGFATEEEVKETIHDTYQKTGYVMDTHTAVAAHVCAQYRKIQRMRRNVWLLPQQVRTSSYATL